MSTARLVKAFVLSTSAISMTLAAHYSKATVNTQRYVLEEILVTAQKREQPLQEAPLAISVIDGAQLESHGIASLGEMGGVIPALRTMPLPNTPSNVVVVIRGNAPFDASEVTREGAVATYLDGVYLGRSHGLGMELVDIERIEVLRGPQGTLFGRNAVGGAVSLISKKPTGKFDIKQSFSVGRFDELRSVTHINLPKVAGISAKLDYLHSERDGWVNNTAPGQSDYNEYDKDGGRLSARWEVNDALMIDYHYDQSRVKTAQNYYQLYKDTLGVFGEERDRLTSTRFPVTPLKPTVVDHQGHGLTVSWDQSDSLTIKSISGYRNLEEDANNNYAGVLYFNGLIDASTMEQDQYSQEFQFIGTRERLEWVAGAYYLEEEVSKTLQNEFTLDIFGFVTGTPLGSIDPPTNFNVFTGTDALPRIIDAEAQSLAVYGQATWSPEIWDDRLQLTIGSRYTEDEKSGTRIEADQRRFDQDSEHVDVSATIRYAWNAHVSTYLKWGTAYKAGGVNTRSASFAPFNEEVAETLEFGLKSEFMEKKVRLNIALFQTQYEDMQLDFSDPVNPLIAETINAANPVDVNGLEIDVTAVPLTGLKVGLSYTYLDDDIPLQPNPLANGVLKEFFLSQTPQHAGALTADYRFTPGRFGTFIAHVNMTSTDHYAYAPFGEQRTDAYTLWNGRFSLTDIAVGSSSLTFSVWGKNLSDEEYIVNAFPVGDPAVTVAQAFGTPRTIGIDVIYEFSH